MPKYIIEIPEDRVTSDGKLRFMACIDSPLANWIYTGIFAELFDRKAIEDEVWDLAQKLGDMNQDQWISCFGIDSSLKSPSDYDYKEAKEKYEAWKESKEEIHVGDEIRIKTSYSADAVVIGMDDYDLFIVWKDGETDRIEPPERKQWVKTGRHFKEVEELLKKITKESNED